MKNDLVEQRGVSTFFDDPRDHFIKASLQPQIYNLEIWDGGCVLITYRRGTFVILIFFLYIIVDQRQRSSHIEYGRSIQGLNPFTNQY